MTISFFAGRSTLHRLHQTVQRNILKNHQSRYESTKQPPSQHGPGNTSPTASSTPPPPPIRLSIPGPTWAWIDPLMRPLRGYQAMQKRSPLMTQWESALVIWYLGDLCSQTVSTNVFLDAQYEPIRGLRAMVIGSISAIPGYKWFLFLGNHFNYRSHLLSLAVKVVVNQTFFTPVFNTYFFGMQTLLAGGSFADAKERVIHTVPVSWKNSWKLWPAVTAFSFTFIPWQHRNVFAGVIAIGWQTYLTWLNRKDEQRQAMRTEEGRRGKAESVFQEERVRREKVETMDLEEKRPVKKKKRRKVRESEMGEEGGKT